MKLFMVFYLGFTIGLCFMDYIDVKNTIDLHIYKRSMFNLIITMILAPFIFPFYLLFNLIYLLRRG